MQAIPIQAIPNQHFTIGLDNNQWDISIKSANGSIAVTLQLNGKIVVSNARAVANMRIIQAKYLEAGNFAFIIPNESVPDYTQFGISQTLVYISPDELTASRMPLNEPLAATDFDQTAGLPLRFKPQGYKLA